MNPDMTTNLATYSVVLTYSAMAVYVIAFISFALDMAKRAGLPWDAILGALIISIVSALIGWIGSWLAARLPCAARPPVSRMSAAEIMVRFIIILPKLNKRFAHSPCGDCGNVDINQ